MEGKILGVKSLVGVWVLSLIFFSAIMLYSCVSISCDGDGQLEVLLGCLWVIGVSKNIRGSFANADHLTQSLRIMTELRTVTLTDALSISAASA
ncbi:hypothetical protein RJ641_007627, partial [Dillenia turbinata]